MALVLPEPSPVTSRLPRKYDLMKRQKSQLDREDVTGITIDGKGTTDLDDAIYCEDLGDGFYKLQVHIADLTEIVVPESAMDLYARARICTAYMEEYTSHMLSRNIATNIASLNEDGKKSTISYECIIDDKGNIDNERYYRSLFLSTQQCDYDSFYQQGDNLIKDINKVSHIVGDIIGNVYESDRGVIDYREKTISMQMSPKFIIERLSVFANYRIAMILNKNFDVGIYRNQLHAGDTAKYSSDMKRHADLNLPGYTHFTSPIRRYPDNIAHRILLGEGNYQYAEVKDLCEYINRRIEEIKIELKMKNFDDKYKRGKRRIKRVKQGVETINFSQMNWRQFKFNLIYYSRSEFHHKGLKKQFLDELERRYNLDHYIPHRSLLLYLFLVGDKDFKKVSYKLLIDNGENDTTIGNQISCFFDLEQEVEIDQLDFEYRVRQLRFKGKKKVLYRKKVILQQTKGSDNNLSKRKIKFITEAVLNGGINMRVRNAISLVE